jgi:hypothetical protein
LLIEVRTPQGQQSGLLHDSVVSCINLATVTEDRIDRVIGHLPDELTQVRDFDHKIGDFGAETARKSNNDGASGGKRRCSEDLLR